MFLEVFHLKKNEILRSAAIHPVRVQGQSICNLLTDRLQFADIFVLPMTLGEITLPVETVVLSHLGPDKVLPDNSISITGAF